MIDKYQQRIDACFAEIADILQHTDWGSLSAEHYLESETNPKHRIGVVYGLALVRKMLTGPGGNGDLQGYNIDGKFIHNQNEEDIL